MTDGAHSNMKAKDAMGFIVGGGDYPESVEAAEFEKMIREAPMEAPGGDAAFNYDTSSNAIARSVLEAYEKYPQLRDLAIDHVLLRDQNGHVDWSNPIVLNVDLYDVLKKLHPDDSPVRKHYEDMTGFMWGWAVNAARKILGLGPVPNPAIMTIRTG